MMVVTAQIPYAQPVLPCTCSTFFFFFFPPSSLAGGRDGSSSSRCWVYTQIQRVRLMPPFYFILVFRSPPRSTLTAAERQRLLSLQCRVLNHQSFFLFFFSFIFLSLNRHFVFPEGDAALIATPIFDGMKEYTTTVSEEKTDIDHIIVPAAVVVSLNPLSAAIVDDQEPRFDVQRESPHVF
jgi:hypothetical protein